ncbi:MAG: hypothetical protein U0271_22925 [Polyangiaceae bacterium]
MSAALGMCVAGAGLAGCTSKKQPPPQRPQQYAGYPAPGMPPGVAGTPPGYAPNPAYPQYPGTAYPQYPGTAYPQYPGASASAATTAYPQYPYAVPSATATATISATPITTAPPPAAIPEIDVCLGTNGTAADCKVALQRMAVVDQPPGKLEEVYHRACKLGAKLMGCGIFKSSALTDADKPDLERLIACEMGRPEACEDMKPKPPPLVAWHQTLKADLCKKGENALCASYKQCKSNAEWTCEAQSGAAGEQKVCGCAQRCEGGGRTVKATTKSWPDGSVRGVFTCGG